MRRGLSLAILGRQYARDGKQQSVHELVIHHHESAVKQIHRDQDRPE